MEKKIAIDHHCENLTSYNLFLKILFANQQPVKPTTNPTNKIWDILMILFVIIFPHIGLLPMFLYPILVLIVLWLYLKIYRETFSSIGFRFKDFNFRALFYGSLVGLIYAVFAYWMLDPLFRLLGFAPANLNDFNFLRHNTKNYVYLLALACLLVIPYEEIVFRGFIFSRFDNWFKGHPRVFLYSSLATSVLFALYHYQEGWGAVLQIFIFALVQMLIFKLTNRNLWYLIFFHIAYDVFMLTAIWKGYM